ATVSWLLSKRHLPWVERGRAAHLQSAQVCVPKVTCSQHRLLAHSDWNIVMSVIFSYESHHRPVLLRVIGVKCDELIGAVFIESVHLDGILQSISKKKHFHLHWKKINFISHSVTPSYYSMISCT
uniref:Uncharacterized protein n=1 Tax=Ficedula albicollis TaxID=59894 RepID=A0A803VZ49_FICAL